MLSEALPADVEPVLPDQTMPVGTHATVEEWERNGKVRVSFRNLVMGVMGGGGGEGGGGEEKQA